MRYQQRKKQKWTEEVREIEKSRDENNERKKLEAKIKKLMERDIQRKTGFAHGNSKLGQSSASKGSSSKKGSKLI